VESAAHVDGSTRVVVVTQQKSVEPALPATPVLQVRVESV